MDRSPTAGSPRSTAPDWVAPALAVYAITFLVYSLQWAFTWDESFHLLAAQLISAGKRPYLDFAFPQTVLNVYWNAAWMRLLGQSWRVPHFFAALFTLGAVALTGRSLQFRFPAEQWRDALALTAALLTGLNAMVFIYGPLGQAYGICLFSLVAAYVLTVRAAEQPGLRTTLAAGFFAGAAAASTLLSGAAAPVLAIWILLSNRAGDRWRKLAAFTLAAAIPFIPVLRLAIEGPRQAWFNLIQYHAVFRQLYWPDTRKHDFEIWTSWLQSAQAALLGILAVAGLTYIARRSDWSAARKSEYYLCGWLAAAIAVEVGSAHPTFSRYFLLAVPFLAILAAVGLYAIASRVCDVPRPYLAAAPLLVIMAAGLGRSLYDHHQDMGEWRPFEQQARRIDEVTPRGAPLYADEPMYFLTRRTPPPGLELTYSHKVDLGRETNALLHILTKPEIKAQVQSGMFATAYSCDDDEISDLGLENLYRQRDDIADCSIFWDRRK